MRRTFFSLLVLTLLAVGISGTSFAAYSINNETDPSLIGSTLVDFESGPLAPLSHRASAASLLRPSTAFMPERDFLGRQRLCRSVQHTWSLPHYQLRE